MSGIAEGIADQHAIALIPEYVQAISYSGGLGGQALEQVERLMGRNRSGAADISDLAAKLVGRRTRECSALRSAALSIHGSVLTYVANGYSAGSKCLKSRKSEGPTP